jgi:hypothetical protein
MMFLNSKKSFQSLGSEYSLRMADLKVSRYFLFYSFGTNKTPKTVLKTRLSTEGTYFGFRLFPKPFKEGILSVFGRFVEEYLRLT